MPKRLAGSMSPLARPIQPIPATACDLLTIESPWSTGGVTHGAHGREGTDVRDRQADHGERQQVKR